jgi:hypothetical protein
MIDLRPYWPLTSHQVKLNKTDGSDHARYTLGSANPSFVSLYNTYHSLGKAGTPYTWRKEYKISGAWCTKTYAVMFLGDDLSITETGDWLASSGCTPNVLFGYKTALASGQNAGLLWAGAGGIDGAPATAEVFICAQAAPGAAYETNGYQAFSRCGIVAEHETFTPEIGRSAGGVWGEGNAKTYDDVLHIVMYHGTKAATPAPVRCTPPMIADGAYYQSFKDYSSYAIELWLAKDKGIIQERTPFIEDATYWGIPNCAGELFSTPRSWTTYIDD